MTYDDQTTQRQHLEQSQPFSSHLSYSSHFRSSAGVHTKLRSSASGRSHQCARRLRVASALATHGALYLADHCTQGQQPRRSCGRTRTRDFRQGKVAPCRLRRAAAAWSNRYDPLLRHGVEGADGLGSLGYQTGTSEPKPDEHGRATCPEWLSSKEARGEAKQGVHAKFDPTSVRYFLVTIRVRYPSTRSHIPHRRVPYSYCTVVWFISTL